MTVGRGETGETETDTEIEREKVRNRLKVISKQSATITALRLGLPRLPTEGFRCPFLPLPLRFTRRACAHSFCFLQCALVIMFCDCCDSWAAQQQRKNNSSSSIILVTSDTCQINATMSCVIATWAAAGASAIYVTLSHAVPPSFFLFIFILVILTMSYHFECFAHCVSWNLVCAKWAMITYKTMLT